MIANLSRLICSLCVLVLLSPATPVYASENTPPNSTPHAPLVVELFTSKYCPACPQADSYFNRLLDQHPDMIGITCHVTYFNGAARRDELSHPFCDARQGVYKLALNTGGIFTPMTIVQGSDFTSGQKSGQMQALVVGATTPAYQSVGLRKNGHYLDINLPSMDLSAAADVWLLEIRKTQNRSGYDHYRNTVSNITKLLRWNGHPLNAAFPIDNDSPDMGYAVLVQTYKGGVITAGKTGF